MEDSRGPSRLAVTRRRAVALAIAAAVIAIAWFVFLRGDDQEPATQNAPAALSAETSAAIDAMTPAELADQVLLLGFEGADGSAEFLDQVRARQLGGVLVGAPNWVDSATGTGLVGAIRAAGREGDRIPPLLVASQEGGKYRAFADLPPAQTELEIGDAGSAEAAENWARQSAEALRSAGFDLNLFPIADVATLDSPIADRAFSDDAASTAELTAAAIRGCNQAGLACAALHFPGLGAASEDTDSGPATVGLDAATLESRDLAPFAAAFAERMPAVVLSLAFYVAYDPVTPAALSQPVATGLLRDQLGYEGVAITDDLGAGAVRSGNSVPKAAVAALVAGADLVRIDAPEDQIGVQAAILTAVADGELPQERLEQAAGRVLELKRSRGLLGT
jgi:beta-N-acetylhexosaminidase